MSQVYSFEKRVTCRLCGKRYLSYLSKPTRICNNEHSVEDLRLYRARLNIKKEIDNK